MLVLIIVLLGKGPKIKKRESMVFDSPLTLTMVFLLRIFFELFFLWFDFD